MSLLGEITINGTKYDLDDLELDEAVEVEELVQRKCLLPDGTLGTEPTPIGEMNFNSARAVRALATVLLRRDDPDVEAGKVKMASLVTPTEEMPDLPPAEAGEANGSSPADSGAPHSAAPISG